MVAEVAQPKNEYSPALRLQKNTKKRLNKAKLVLSMMKGKFATYDEVVDELLNHFEEKHSEWYKKPEVQAI